MASKTLTDIAGVYASGIASGIKHSSLDLAYIFVPNACASAGVFTKNLFRAPCVDYSENAVQENTIKAVIVNAGNANAATGKPGLVNAKRTAEVAANLLGIAPSEVAALSTGIIGVPLPIEKIEQGLQKLLVEPHQSEGPKAAEAILTTDTCSKEIYLEKTIGEKTIAVAGFAKGSGMIAPNMATMLGFLATNVTIEQEALEQSFRRAVDNSFNMVSVDTDTSTNDSCLVFATGEVSLDNDTERLQFEELLSEACVYLAKRIARDGEGAEKLIEVVVRNAASQTDARTMALNVVNSPLVKTAIHGADPNWGRIMMAVGKDDALELDTKRVEMSICGEKIFANGQALDFDESQVAELLKKEEVQIVIDLGIADRCATAWGCDLTKGYIDINVDYN